MDTLTAGDDVAGYLQDTIAALAAPLKRKQTTRWRKVICTVPECAFSCRMTRKAFEANELRCPDMSCSGALTIADQATEEA